MQQETGLIFVKKAKGNLNITCFSDKNWIITENVMNHKYEISLLLCSPVLSTTSLKILSTDMMSFHSKN